MGLTFQCHRRICCQCTLRTQLFNQHQTRAEMAAPGMVRHLDDMLALKPNERQAYSFCCAGDGWMHGPLAISTVDPAVLQLDFHCMPPDRWHGTVDMIDDLTTVVREGLRASHQAELLTQRFREAPRSDVYDRLKAGIFNLHRKTGAQLLSMFRQLLVVGHGLIPTRDWEAMIAYVRWADLLWLDSYKGLLGLAQWGGHMVVGWGVAIWLGAWGGVGWVGCCHPSCNRKGLPQAGVLRLGLCHRPACQQLPGVSW